jgi:hypothetical protein
MPGWEVALSRPQKNELFRAIQSAGVPIGEFELSSTVARKARNSKISFSGRQGTPFLTVKDFDHPVAIVHHPASKSAFAIIAVVGDEYESKSFVAAKGLSTNEMLDRWVSQLSAHGVRFSPEILGRATAWAREVGRWMTEEVYTSDLWEELLTAKSLFGEQSGKDFGNAPFDSEEQAKISEQIRQIKAYIRKTHQLSNEQFSRIEARLDEADQASRRIGRKDWLMTFNGAVFSLVLSDLIPPSAAQNILIVAVHGLGHLFGITPPLPPPLLGS